MGSHDMLEVANMALHVGQLTGVQEIISCFHAVTSNAAKTLNLENYGLTPGSDANLIILQAENPIEAIRLQAERLYVIRRGQILASTPTRQATIHAEPLARTLDFTHANLMEG